MFVETWCILLGEHEKAQHFIYVIWVISNTKSRIFKTLKIGLWYQGSYIAVGTPQWKLGDFFPSFLGTHIWPTDWDLWWPASRAIYEPTHRRCHLFLESLGWWLKRPEDVGLKPRRCSEMLETDLPMFCKIGWLFLFGMLKCYENPTETVRIDVEKSEVSEVWSVRIGK